MNQRLLYLTPGCFDKGGISRYSRYQVSAWREVLGPQNVRVVSLLGPGEGSLEAAFDVDWHGRGAGPEARTADRLQFSACALKQASLWRPTLIHSAHVNFGPLVTLGAVVSRATTMLNVYGLEIWSGLSAVRRRHMRKIHRVIADCHFTSNYVRAEQLHDLEPTVIWDPVDLERFCPGPPSRDILAKYGIPDPAQHFIVMSLGRLARAASHKGFDRLIDAVAGLVPQAPDLRLVIAGKGDDRPRLEALTAERGIGDRVVFAGAVEENDLADVYRCAHVFSLVSDRGNGRGEGIPLTPLEAMACGVPVVVGNEDGSQEAVIAGRNGFVVSPRRPDELRAALAQMLGNPERRGLMSREARLVAEENFGYPGFVAKHRALLERHLHEHRSRPLAMK